MNIQKSSADLYAAYKETTQKAADLNNASAVLGWDQEVYMPSKGFEVRGRQLATLASLAHEMLTSEAYGNQLQELAGRGDLADDEKRNVALSLEDYNKNKKLSAAFVEAITQQTSASYNAWIQSRKENKFSIYAPELDKMIQLKKQQASMYGYESNPYDALLDEYEKGASVALLDRVFGDVKQQLPVLLDKIKAEQQVDDSFFLRNYPKQAQWDFSMDVLRAMGYDFEAGRQDISEHPFTTSFAPTDVRVTTRVDENNYSSLLWSSIHEGGHALYEQGLPIEQYGLPLGAAASLGIHESQSRMWENNVGRGKQFWHHFYPALQQYFPQQLNDISVEAFYKGMNKVEPSLIRTEADEVTYHFHVMIRYEIEKGLMNGDLFTEDLPEAWNGLYNKYLGISAQDDKTGVLQDVHWAHGSFGYFPTYSLGSFYAAQFYQQAVKEMPTLADDIANGRLLGLREWLRGKVHQYGRRYTSEELCQQITGGRLDFKVFMQYAHEKYAGIYGF